MRITAVIIFIIISICTCNLLTLEDEANSEDTGKKVVISGRAELLFSVSNKEYIVTVDNDHDRANGFVEETKGEVSNSFFDFEINVIPGTYFIYAEVNYYGEPGIWEPGDFIGDACIINEEPCKLDIYSDMKIDIKMCFLVDYTRKHRYFDYRSAHVLTGLGNTETSHIKRLNLSL